MAMTGLFFVRTLKSHRRRRSTVGFDSKWSKATETFDIPKWEITVTNLQFREAEYPKTVFAYDTIVFPPITNACIPSYIGNTFRGDFIELGVRCSGCEKILAANIIFVPVVSNVFKPFVTRGIFDKEGKIHLLPTPQEMEQATNL
jgi:hypothetical protein